MDSSVSAIFTMLISSLRFCTGLCVLSRQVRGACRCGVADRELGVSGSFFAASAFPDGLWNGRGDRLLLKRDVQCIQKMRVFAVEAARGFRDPVNAVVQDLRDFDFLPGAAEELRFDAPAERGASAGP